MDFPTSREDSVKRRARISIMATAVFMGLLLILAMVLIPRTTVTIAESELQIHSVELKTFAEYITVRGVVVPSRTVILDLDEGGKVVELYFEEGDTVKKGDLIAELDNSNLRLSVTSREAEVSEQVNNLRNTRIDMERESLDVASKLRDIEYNILRLEKLIERRMTLVNKKLISHENVDLLEDELNHYRSLQQLTLKRQKTDQKFRESQIELLESTTERLRSQMTLARASLDQLHVKAPMAGVLSSLDVEVGQRLNSGNRLGVIDTEHNYDLSAYISEYYITRIVKGLSGIAELNENNFSQRVIVNRIYPNVKDGQFEVRFTFPDNINISMLRRGQSVNVKLFFSEEVKSLTIPRSTLLEDKHKNWVFVLDPKSNIAVRRSISIGRRNPDDIEVVSGVNAGELIVSASHISIREHEQLRIK